IRDFHVTGVQTCALPIFYMPKLERQQRMRSNVSMVKKFNISHWVKLFFARLHEVKSEQEASASRKMQGATLQKLTDKFQQAQRRLFFLDYDGTLAGFKNDASAAKPTAQVMELLASLQSDED